MLQLLQQSNFSYGSTRDALLFSFKFDFFQSVNLTRLCVSCLVHYSIGAFANVFKLFVSINFSRLH